MAGNLGKWPSKRGPISKFRPSDGCRRDAVPLAVGRWYDFPEFGCHLGNVDSFEFRLRAGISHAWAPAIRPAVGSGHIFPSRSAKGRFPRPFGGTSGTELIEEVLP